MTDVLLKILTSSKNEIEFSSRKLISKLVENRVLLPQLGKPRVYTISFGHTKSLLFFIGEIERNTNIKFSESIDEIFDIPRKIEGLINQKLKTNYIGYSDGVIKNIIKRYLILNHNGHKFNLISHLYVIERSSKDEYKKGQYAGLLFEVIYKIECTDNEIIEALNLIASKANRISSLHGIVKNLCATNVNRTVKIFNLYDISIGHKKNILYFFFLSFLYNYTKNSFFLKLAISHYESYRKEFFVFMNNLDYSKKININILFNHLKSIDNLEEQDAINYTNSLTRLLNYKLLTPTHIKYLFGYLNKIISSNSETTSYYIIEQCVTSIDNYEEERYDLITKALNIGRIKILQYPHLFDNFKKPKYFFEFYESICNKFGIKTDFKFIANGINSLLRLDSVSTLKLLSKMFAESNLQLRFGGIKLLIEANGIANDFLMRDTNEVIQKRAIEAFSWFPYGIEHYFRYLLEFRNSQFKNVKNYLLDTLVYLTIEAYGDGIYNLIMDNTSSKVRSRAIFKKYNEAKIVIDEHYENKNAVNELNPNKNETGMINLFYELEREQNAKLMDEAQKSSFLYIMGSTEPYIIVRANSWRNEDGKITPLTKNSIYRLVDFRIYKFPERFEKQVSTTKAKF